MFNELLVLCAQLFNSRSQTALLYKIDCEIREEKYVALEGFKCSMLVKCTKKTEIQSGKRTSNAAKKHKREKKFKCVHFHSETF